MLGSGAVHAVHDTIDAQLTELIRTREPHRRFTEAELAEAISDQLAGAARWEYGVWAWYPWSARLVHVLPREEIPWCVPIAIARRSATRTAVATRPQDRHRRTVRRQQCGGHPGAGRHRRVVPPRRLRRAETVESEPIASGIHDLGVNKAVLCARQMFEIDPYLDIEIMPTGLTADTMAQFVGDQGERLDLLVEECDTPYVKIAAREAARAQRIPVVMDCNDRGMLDIERFDLQAARTLHGPSVTCAPTNCRTHPRRQADLILAMVDAERISPELAAAFPEIGRTLSSGHNWRPTWPGRRPGGRRRPAHPARPAVRIRPLLRGSRRTRLTTAQHRRAGCGGTPVNGASGVNQ